jgi:hypothetical protein
LDGWKSPKTEPKPDEGGELIDMSIMPEKSCKTIKKGSDFLSVEQ